MMKSLKLKKGTAKVLNAFFSNIVQNLDIQQYNVDDLICENINDPLLKAIVRYRNHPSIVAIKKFCNSKSHFSFKNIQKKEILKELNNLNISKATQNTDISTELIKENSYIFGGFIFSNLNCCINSTLYPWLLKKAHITPVRKKDSKSAKNNYRSVSIMPNIPKLYEWIMFKQMSEYVESSFFSKYQCGFQKDFNAQHCLVSMREKWKCETDNKRSFGALLTYLSKAFDCLSYDLLIAKLNACQLCDLHIFIFKIACK